MKKLVLFVVFCVLCLPVFAAIDQGVKAGDFHLSILGGFGVPIQKYGSNLKTITDDTADFGSASFTYGAQAMFYLTDIFGLGLEFNGANYSKSTYSITAGETSSEEKFSANKYSFFLAGKINLAPSAKTRLYIPLGAGFAKFTGKVDFYINGASKSADDSSSKPAFYAGLGLDHDINDIWFMGAEARYNYWLVDDNKFDTKNLSDISLMLKIGLKF